MNRALRALVCLAILGAGPAAAQPEAGSVPAGEGIIRGRVLHPSQPDAVGGLEVVLYALPPDGQPGLSRTLSDAQGGFAFPGVSNAPDTVYLVGVRADDIPYGRRVVFAAGQRELDVELEVAGADPDATGVERGASFLRLDRGCSSLLVNEAHQLGNPTQRVIHVPTSARPQHPPVFRALLPAGAGEISTPMGIVPEGLERRGRELLFWGPLYPGSQELEFSYALPLADAMSLERGFPDGAARVVILTDVNGPRVEGAGLQPAPSENRPVDGRPYRAVAASGIAAGAELALHIVLPETPEPPISFARSQIWLELDDVALTAEEQHVLALEDELRADSDAPLLCLELPRGVEALSFAPAALALGLGADPSGALVVRGPIPAGETPLALRYRLPLAGDEVRFERRLPRALGLLSVLVADTGVLTTTERLHRRRPVRSNDRNYLHFEGFAFEPGEPIQLDFQRLEAPRAMPRLARAGVTLLAAAAALVFLAGPLRGDAPERAMGESQGEQLAAERAAVIAAIRDLDEDFETGKLSQPDHAGMRADLRARAVQLLQQERAASAASAKRAQQAEGERSRTASAQQAEGERTASAERAQRDEGERSHEADRTARPSEACPSCAAELPAAARFCPQCGDRISTEDGAA